MDFVFPFKQSASHPFEIFVLGCWSPPPLSTAQGAFFLGRTRGRKNRKYYWFLKRHNFPREQVNVSWDHRLQAAQQLKLFCSSPSKMLFEVCVHPFLLAKVRGIARQVTFFWLGISGGSKDTGQRHLCIKTEQFAVVESLMNFVWTALPTGTLTLFSGRRFRIGEKVSILLLGT